MTTSTRSQAKKEDDVTGAPPASEAEPGSKHKTAVSEPEAKRPKKSDKKEQQTTIEETIGGDAVKPNNKEVGSHTRDESAPPSARHEHGSAVEPNGRDDSETVPSSILEKGIIYFFFRGRVDVDEPSDINDIARSFILLRPIEKDAKLGSGPIGDAGNSRLCGIPKKVLPQSGRDRWIAFVEKAGTSFEQLKKEFLSSEDYTTKTVGTRHTPAATPVGEGVYAITSTGRESHLVYMLTLPEEIGEVQKEIGLKGKGAFILSTKNPEFPGPASTRLPKSPEYPEEVIKEFRSLRWMPTQPKHLDYANTQFLLIGESSGVDKALEPQEEDKQKGVQAPADELEKLEEEDAKRMKGLSKDDSSRVFADLQVNARDYPKLQTTF
ncbi:hypothetical protein B0T25DRAFT_526615 [Lasiosphaeria hispida]|uniref:BTB domain transcription factor n=1 Tax=Lasiosphaeria hispida TaxID=260671 RepID=A0AAJ0HUM7_9PEZI|nr:hypothetical protein B0T25DRAFT_526615 [Lasiosphaeria hispida]